MDATTLDDIVAGESVAVRRTIEVLAAVLSGAVDKAKPTVDAFLTEHLGAPRRDLASHYVRLSPSTMVAAGLVVAELADEHGAIIGPDEDDDPPQWVQHTVGEDEYSIPSDATFAFAPGNPFGAGPLAIQITAHPGYARSRITVMAPHSAGDAFPGAVVSDLTHRIRERNPLRGRVIRAEYDGGIEFSVVDGFTASRGRVQVPDAVWREVDLAVSAVTTRYEALRTAGLSTSRGLMLAGLPGVGKTAVARTVMSELAGQFTIVIAGASAMAYGIAEIYRAADEFGPMVVLLDDVDLHVGRRGDGNDGALGALLAALDGADKLDRVLTIATTNDPKAIDHAATRAARFDSIVEIEPPSDAAVAAILRELLGALPRADVDTLRVAASFPVGRSGADVVEAVRRAVLIDGAEVTTSTMLEVIGAREYAASVPVGTYL
ncbi:putative AAA family ATPase [Gordonia araii NBRC 100433]|uniref:Putative AAA family ATPase n=1 Tax=Gordonia araii NBRC 100433 TaxID=1073574 RepID=G7H4I5_9ACTN|nr:ATP-binding protein [Gordonia araii]NNG96183.1 ATP-binding protein [Gordonia araii NBRC 100433]GAB10760.1 putative AAA family ATPase [Gordonia araii NBRC 100433]